MEQKPNKRKSEKEVLLKRRVGHYSLGIEDYIGVKVNKDYVLKYCLAMAKILKLPKKMCKDVVDALPDGSDNAEK